MRALLVALCLAIPGICTAKAPACDHWPMKMAQSVLFDAHITSPDKLDESKTRAVRLASEPIGRDLYQQVYDITFRERTGRVIEVITSSKASNEECSMGSVDVFTVSNRFNSDTPIRKE